MFKMGKGKLLWHKTKNGIKVIFTSGQIAASLPSVIPAISFPEVFKAFIKTIQGLNFNFFSFVPVGCWAKDVNYYHLALAMIVPVLSVCLALIVLGFTFRSKKEGFHTVSIAVSYLTLPTITTFVFGLFPCDQLDDGRLLLRSDYGINCEWKGRWAWETFGYAMVFIFPLGIPLIYLVLLYRVKDRLMDDKRLEDEKVRSLIFLWEPYKKEYWYFEVVETTRRLMLTGLLSLIQPGTFTQLR